MDSKLKFKVQILFFLEFLYLAGFTGRRPSPLSFNGWVTCVHINEEYCGYTSPKIVPHTCSSNNNK